MTTQPEFRVERGPAATDEPFAVGIAKLLEREGRTIAAAELRRLHAENASLSAALASSCDEQRHELWESGGIAGCERARVAERQRDALLEALRMFVSCAIPVSTKIDERGYGWTQAYLDQALPKARAAIKAVEEGK